MVKILLLMKFVGTFLKSSRKTQSLCLLSFSTLILLFLHLFAGIETDGLKTCFTLMQTSADGTKEDAEVIFSQLTGECEKLTVVSGNGEFIAGIDDKFLLLHFLKGKKRPTR